MFPKQACWCPNSACQRFGFKVGWKAGATLATPGHIISQPNSDAKWPLSPRAEASQNPRHQPNSRCPSMPSCSHHSPLSWYKRFVVWYTYADCSSRTGVPLQNFGTAKKHRSKKEKFGKVWSWQPGWKFPNLRSFSRNDFSLLSQYLLNIRCLPKPMHFVWCKFVECWTAIILCHDDKYEHVFCELTIR